jgi:SAM-dependent methyltransferase
MNIKNIIQKLPGYSILRSVSEQVTRACCTDEHWIRVVMNRETAKIIGNLSVEKLHVLELSGERWKDGGFKSYTSLAYPDYDICEIPLKDRFDLIVAEQVFEHLLWPYKAANNVYEMLSNNGYFLVTTPFLIRIHNHPVDCSRWTETGMKYFLAESGFSIDKIRTGSWGNKACLKANLKDWKRYCPWAHSLKNEPDFPLVVWAFAQK